VCPAWQAGAACRQRSCGSRRLWLRGRHGVGVDHRNHRGPQRRRAPEHAYICRAAGRPLRIPLSFTWQPVASEQARLLCTQWPAPCNAGCRSKRTQRRAGPRAGPFVTVFLQAHPAPRRAPRRALCDGDLRGQPGRAVQRRAAAAGHAAVVLRELAPRVHDHRLPGAPPRPSRLWCRADDNMHACFLSAYLIVGPV